MNVTTSAMFRASASEIGRQHFSLRSQIPLRANILWKIETGIVRALTWLEDGTVVTLGVWGPGDVVGKALSQVSPYHLECLTKVEVSILPDSSQTAEIFKAYTDRAEELLIIRSYRKTDMILLKLLSWLSKRFGRAVEQGQLIDLRLTHQDIAEILGTTRVTVTRLLSQFEQQGVIERLPLHRIVLKEAELWHYEI